MEKFLENKLSFLPEEKRATVIFILDIILNVIIIAVLVYVIRSFLISPFQVYGPSMCNTLNYINDHCEEGYGEYIIVNRALYQNFFGLKVGSPSRGDIVVFKPPTNEKEFFIKRIIGLPGETIKLKDGYVYIYNQEHPEGYQLPEPYLSPVNQGNTKPSPYSPSYTEFKVPENQYFVLGDNRTRSSDSRMCFKENFSSGNCGDPGITPYIKPESIEGKASVVLWPVNKFGMLEDPKY